MGYGESNHFGWCNLLIKFALFFMNFIVWLLGCGLLAAGIFAQIELGAISQVGFATLLFSPSIILIILGGVMFLLGFFGCLGALREIFILLLIYAGVLSFIVLAEIGLAVYIYFQQDQARMAFGASLQTPIEQYYENPDIQSIVDALQQYLLCCGAAGPNDWQANRYFACNSIAYQRCSVPFSCCIPEQGENVIINTQCGYRRLDNSTDRFNQGIYLQGCVAGLEAFFNQYVYYIAGVGIGLLVFQLINIMLTIGLAIDVKKEQNALKRIKKQQKRQRKHDKDISKL